MAFNKTSMQYANGPVAQTVLNTDLLSGVASGYIDVEGWNTISVQVIATAGISAGAIIFEQSNDGVNFTNAPAYEPSVTSGSVGGGATTINASTTRLWVSAIGAKYYRCRISTGFSGGSVQAFYLLSERAVNNSNTAVRNSSAANFLVTTTPTSGTAHTLNSAASTNATSVKASAGAVYNLTVSNVSASTRFMKLYNKASAPTVGTDTPVIVIPVAATSSVTLSIGPVGQQFTTGIAYAITGLIADSDTTAISAGDVKVAMTYI